MANPKEAESTHKEKSQTSGFDCCSQNFDDMFKKMQEFCDSKEKSFDCCEMMRNMSGETSKKSQK